MSRFGWVFVAIFTFCLGAALSLVITTVFARSGSGVDLTKAPELETMFALFVVLAAVSLISALVNFQQNFGHNLKILKKQLRNAVIRPIVRIERDNITFILAFDVKDRVCKYRISGMKSETFQELLMKLPTVSELPVVNVVHRILQFRNPKVFGEAELEGKCLDIDSSKTVVPEANDTISSSEPRIIHAAQID